MRSLKSESGQGLVEYAITLVLVALLVCVAIGGFYFLAILILIPFWSAIMEWGTNLVAGLQRGDPKAIFIAVVIVLVFLFLFGNRRR